MDSTESVRLNKAKTLLREAQGALMHGATLNILRPGQKILADAGVRETQDLEVAKRMIEQGCNIGMKPGPRLLIIDVDVKAGDGIESWKHLTRRGLPDTRKVITPSGGFHCYYTMPPNIERIKAVHSDYPHIDFLSGGHNVVLGGSTVSGNCYEVVNNVKAAPAPSWLIKMIDNSSNTFGLMEPGTLDIEELKNLLAQINPDGLQYQDWVNVGFAIHHEMRGDEDGLGRGLKLWHDWSSRSSKYEVERGRTDKVWNSSHADRPGAITIGTIRRMVADAAVNEFRALGPDECMPGADDEGIELGDTEFRVTNEFFEVVPEGRDWIVPGIAVRGYVSGLVGAGGGGKSTLGLHLALAVAAGKDILGFEGIKQGRVLFVSNEEDRDEFQLRLMAAMARHKITPDDLGGRLIIKTGYGKTFTIANSSFDFQRRVTSIQESDEWQKMDGLIFREDIDVLFLDPFSSMNKGVNENDNGEMNQVMGILRQTADRRRLSTVVIHHIAKSADTSNPDAGSRGASAVVASMRCVVGVHKCTAKEGLGTSIPEEEIGNYIKLTGGKSNLAEKTGERYLKLDPMSVPATINGGPAMESVAALEIAPSSLFEKGSSEPTEYVLGMVNKAGDSPILQKDLAEMIAEDREQSSKTGERMIEKSIPEGKDSAVHYCGKLYWRERISVRGNPWGILFQTFQTKPMS